MNGPIDDEDDKNDMTLLAFSPPKDTKLIRARPLIDAQSNDLSCLPGGGHEASKKGMKYLGRSFKPGEFDVICARGAVAMKHPGNQNLKRKIREASNAYTQAPSKVFKSMVVSSILDWFRLKSPNGGFVKQMDGDWYEVGNAMAREKIGQALRDRNDTHYKSSMKAKRRRWKREQTQQEEKQTEVPKQQQGTPGVSPWSEEAFQKRMETHKQTIKRFRQDVEQKWKELGGTHADDKRLLKFFSQRNKKLLEKLKSDAPMQSDALGATFS